MDALTPQIWESVDAVVGWLSPNAADFTLRLLQSESFRQVEGAVVEIGVHKGKYLTLIGYATRGQGRRMIAIDGFFSGYQQPLNEQWLQKARAEIIENISSLSPDQKLEVVRANSEELSPKSFASIVQEK